MQTNTAIATTTENTAALVQEFFDGLGIQTHADGDRVHIYKEEGEEIIPLNGNFASIEVSVQIALLSLGRETTHEADMTDWRMLLDRWDFAE